MTKALDPAVIEALRKYGYGPEACWKSHDVWCVYHRVLEAIAAQAGIWFDAPQVIEANGIARSVAICVVGHLGDVEQWSIGEAAPHNNKNAYPYAMAEKRARDRVILKLIGLHGLVYSEEEIDEPPKAWPTPPTPEPKKSGGMSAAEIADYDKKLERASERGMSALQAQWSETPVAAKEALKSALDRRHKPRASGVDVKKGLAA